MSLDGDPIYSRFVRLTNSQWQRSVQDILGLDAPPDASGSFENAVAGTTDFDNNEHVLSVTNALWESYQQAAEQAADLVTNSSQRLARSAISVRPAPGTSRSCRISRCTRSTRSRIPSTAGSR
jgi:hypothetical protein